MSVNLFRNRRWPLTAGLAAALVGVGFYAVAATVTRAENPAATLKSSQYSESGVRHGYSAVVKQVLPAVVNISSERVVKSAANPLPDEFFRQFFGDQFSRQFAIPQERREKSLGSGVIVSPEGYVLTNNHVVDGVKEVSVTLSDKREMKARVVGTDPRTDIAVLKLTGSSFPYLTLADSSKVEVGDIVLAVGDPFGVGQTVTQGIVSATGRGGLGIEEVEDFIQTDAPINPGNSGGALIDDEGHLIGINTAIVGNSGGSQGIGFAVPVNMAKHDMDQILAHGQVERAYMGILPQDVTPALAQAFHESKVSGALVADITPNSPASRSGLMKGDILTAINGQPIADANQLRLRVGEMEPNTHVTFKVMRNGSPMDISMTLGAYPSSQERASTAPQGTQQNALEGVSVETLTPETARELKVPAQTRGVVIDQVDPGSKAADADLQSGDVIQEVNRQPVRNTDDFNRAMKAAPKDSPVLLVIDRGGNTMYRAVS